MDARDWDWRIDWMGRGGGLRLPMLLIGGIAVVVTAQRSAWGWLVADAAYFALLTLGEEVAFRGYGFQRFADGGWIVGSGVRVCAVLRDHAGGSAGIDECEHCDFGGV